jgi:ubiquinone/menaquinone biosynthesis C-methylase UbiE
MPTMATEPRTAPEIIDFYSQGYDEDSRLTGSADGRLELVRTQELLRAALPDAPADVLDVGGGPGVHARWLTDDGYRVHLIDPVPRHVDQATHRGLSAQLGDARALSADDRSYDVVLLLGPLYHLLEAEDRTQALAEARRVVRPGGLVAAAAINRYASLFEHTATTLLAHDRVQAAVGDILATGRHEPGRKGFTAAYFHTADELAHEVEKAGFQSVKVHGIEGPTWGLLKAAELISGQPQAESPIFEAALRASRLAEPYPDLLAASSHLLATARA